jgi:hypothetical protein
VPTWETQHCFRSCAARDADCCKNNCVPYSIFFCPSEHRRAVWQGDSGKSPVRFGWVWYWRPHRVLQEHLRTLFIFFLAQHPAATRLETVEGPAARLRYGTGLADCCKNICVPYPIFFREIARLSTNSQAAPNTRVVVSLGTVPRLGGLFCRSGWSRAFPTRSWQVNPSRYRFDRRNVFLA